MNFIVNLTCFKIYKELWLSVTAATLMKPVGSKMPRFKSMADAQWAPTGLGNLLKEGFQWIAWEEGVIGQNLNLYLLSQILSLLTQAAGDFEFPSGDPIQAPYLIIRLQLIPCNFPEKSKCCIIWESVAQLLWNSQVKWAAYS